MRYLALALALALSGCASFAPVADVTKTAKDLEAVAAVINAQVKQNPCIAVNACVNLNRQIADSVGGGNGIRGEVGGKRAAGIDLCFDYEVPVWCQVKPKEKDQ